MHVNNSLRNQIKSQIQHQAEHDDAAAQAARPGRFGRASSEEIAGFLREFGILCEAGYPVSRALQLLGRNTHNQDLSTTIKSIADHVERGASVSKAMARFPWYFDAVTINIVKSSEASGKLDQGAHYIADMMEFDQEIREKAVQALTYPAILLGVTVLVVFGMLVFVVPLFAGYIQDAGGQFTGMAAMVYETSQVLRSPMWLSVIVFGGAAAIVGGARWRKNNEAQFDALMGRVPVVGRLFMLAALTRFVNMFHMMSVNGVGVLQCLELAKGALGNAYLCRAIDDMHASVEAGKSMSEPLAQYSDFPPIAIDMLSVGEESGKLNVILASLAKSMRTQLMRTATRLTTVLEPVMLLVLGVVTMAVVSSFFLPYFELLTAIASGR